MQLQLLHHTTCLSTYYDQCNDWLYLEWEGEITLPLAQEACDALATCVLERPYACVLNNNEQVTGIHWNVATWLLTDFLPHLTLADVEQIAWVFSPVLRGQHVVYTILNHLPSGPPIDAFDNLADAVAWLQHFRPVARGAAPTRCPAKQARLVQQVQAIRQRRAATQLQQV